MGPGFHRLYAGRLAWRYRLGLALAMALLGLLHPLWALLSPLALLLPARWWEGRALREIARVSLAYPTALAYGEARLWAEAARVRLEPPSFPWGLLLAYLLALLLALAGTPWRASEGVPTPPIAPTSPTAPTRGAEGPPGGQEPPPGEAPRALEAPSGQGGEGGPGTPGAQGDEGNPGSAEQAPGRERPQGPGGSEGAQGSAGAGQEGVQGPQGASGGEGAQGQGQGDRPGTGGPLPLVDREALPAPTPLGPGQGLLGPGGEGGAPDLPSPWPAGRPPEEVRRGVEVYLERTPLPPEVRELLRRYFGGP
ncbi:hypothetical protein [Thermus sp.]|uniref:hypothetical protein n=1 Tax=Thermus sp. TaxID=275 RepID=UPI002624F29D|nr:hypothetical protein [Thermus sp.]MCX7848789.1 hypothetical protein [Thermus sp.]